MRLVALAAKADHGKTTTANALVARFGARVLSLAGPIKQALLLRYPGLPPELLFGSQEQKLTPLVIEVRRKHEGRPSEVLSSRVTTPRYEMQEEGTERGREVIDQEVWAWALARKAERLGGRVVVDDMRFLSEARTLRQLGARVVVVHCTDPRPNALVRPDHPSETGVNEIVAAHEYDRLVQWSRAEPPGTLAARVADVVRSMGWEQLCPLCRDTGLKDGGVACHCPAGTFDL